MTDQFIQEFNTHFAGYTPFDLFGIGFALSFAAVLLVLLVWVIGKLLGLITCIIDRRCKKDTAI